MFEVPYPPPPGHVETVPPQPTQAEVWVDGQWDWTGDDYRWLDGGWVVPPANARFSPWTTLRKKDGRLYFAPAAWRDERGRVVAAWPSTEPCDVGKTPASTASTAGSQ